MSARVSVLVIEDDPAIARALTRALRVNLLDADVAHSASDVRANCETYPVAIVDVNLPDGNGLDLFQELFDHGKVGASVFFTATDDEGEKARAALAGTLVTKKEGVQVAVAKALQLVQGMAR